MTALLLCDCERECTDATRQIIAAILSGMRQRAFVMERLAET
jgi:hypothetical protein